MLLEISNQLLNYNARIMKLSALFVISFVLVAKGWRQKYGNDFVTYSIGERFERGKKTKPKPSNLFQIVLLKLNFSS